MRDADAATMLALTLPFRLRGHDGRVRVFYGVNDDLARWGFDLRGTLSPWRRH